MQRLLSLALTGLFVAMLASVTSAQSLKPAASVQQYVDRGGSFFSLPLFVPGAAPGKDIDNAVEGAQFLRLDKEELKRLVDQQPESLVLTMPYEGKTVEVELLKTEILTPDFQVVTSESKDRGVAVDAGVHYRGRVQGQANSVAAFSFFKNEVMGLMSDDVYGNRVLGLLDSRGNSENYILYQDKKLKTKSPVFCSTEDVDQRIEPTGQNMSTTEVNGCVRVYIEADYEMFQNKGSVANVTSYLTGVFNQVAALYANESVSTQVSTIYVWTTADSYSNTSSSTALSQFKALRTTFNGDIAHLASLGGNNVGGVAYVDVICNNSFRYAYSNISASYQTVPTYSWTVEVMTHEMGHNLGSNHTQWCGWTGGALDNCYTTEGGCAAGPAPTNGGTIMSYCHLTSYGINFNNGFGTQPGNQIRSRVAAATCLAATCSSSTSCGTPTGLTATAITQSGATLNWTAVSGATSYNVQWKATSASTWNTISGITAATYNLTGLAASTSYSFQVQGNCNGTLSSYSTATTFTTAATASCGTPSGLTATAITQTAATLSWTAVGGSSSYNLQWKAASASTWNTISGITAATYNLSGLAASTSYNFKVQANCNGTLSAYSAASTFTTAAAASCGTPTGLTTTSVTQNSATLTWTAVGGSTSYNLQWKTAAASTWNTTNVTSNSYSLSGLATATSYNFRVQTNCNGTLSSYSATATFTTAAAPSCGVPSGLNATAITQSGATLNWSAISGAISYSLQWKSASSTVWTTVNNITTASYNLSGLASAISYNFQVRATCSSATSAYSAAATFTTEFPVCNDSYEPNNSRTAATALAGNTDINSQIALASDADWFRFSNASGAQNIKVDLTNLPANYDVRLYLNTTQLGISQKTGTAAERIVYNTGTIATNYYVQVYSTGGASSSTECYTLRVSLSGTAWPLGLEGGNGGDVTFEVPVVVQDAGFAIFPNPADETVTMEIPVAEDNTPVSVSIMDISGRVVAQQQSDMAKDANRMNFSLNKMADGVYFVHVRNGNQQSTRKLVVQH